MPRARKPKGPKRVTYELINKDSDVGRPMYRLLRDLVNEHHEEISEARIALAWNTSWRPDVDGRVTLGKCKKATDLDRELAEWDFIILLRKSFWQAREVKDEQRTALLDHELCHAGVRRDERTGDPVRDERRRLVFRTVKHDVEEFQAIVQRHGCWKGDLERMYAAMISTAQPFKPCEECRDSPGYVPTVNDGVAAVTRCQCWIAWRERTAAAREAREDRASA
jgi:hypothetical protein